MMNRPPLWKSYLFLKRNRAKKKSKLRKMALQLMVDKTTAFYLLILSVYVFAVFFIFGDTINQFEDDLIFFEQQAMERIGWLPVILPLAYLFQSIKNPGVLFTSSELKLSYLPFSIKHIWLYTVLEKWIKSFVLYGIIALLLALFMPFSLTFILSYVTLLWLISVLMTIPQWKLFHEKWYVKLIIIFLALLLNGVRFFVDGPLFGLIAIVLLFIINIALVQRLFEKVHWGRVAEINDFIVWRMPLIEQASKQSMKQPKKYSILKNSKRRKKPFVYTEKAIHHRLWQVYFAKNIQLVFRVIGTLFLMITVFRFLNSFTVFIGIAIAIHVLTSTGASFFANRFKSDIVEVLPWDLTAYKKTFLKWVYFGGIPIALPVLSYFIFHFSIWAPVQMLLIYFAFLIHFHVKVNKEISIRSNEHRKFHLEEVAAIASLVLLIFSEKTPALALLFIVFAFFTKKISNRENVSKIENH